METKNQIKGHQGDVQFAAIKSLPLGAKEINHKPLALGEHSGHIHVLTGDVQLFEHEGKMFAAIGNDGAFLQHVHESNFTDKCYTEAKELPIADHAAHKLPTGIYEFHIQNAYNPYAKIMEKVID